MRQELGIAAEFIQGDRGVFDVRVDDALLFSKKAAGRFPAHDEIFALIRARQAKGS